MLLSATERRAAQVLHAQAISEQLRRQERRKCERSLFEFVKAAWSSFDSSPFQANWAIEAVCEHLEAITRGDIRRLLINLPPRCSKTNVVSICWPAWVWAQPDETYTSGPAVRFLVATNSHRPLGEQIAISARRLLLSPWYQSLWGKRFSLVKKGLSQQLMSFENSAGGARLGTSVEGGLLGIGGAILIGDDLNNAQQIESELERTAVLNFWGEFSTTRMNDPRQSAIVNVQQRVHVDDVSGHILESKSDNEFTHLMIPMRYDATRHCTTEVGEKTWTDPRTEEGELMWSERIGEAELADAAIELGSYRFAGRYQQLPRPATGGIIKSTDWRLWDEDEAAGHGIPHGAFPHFEYVLASLDTAYTEKQENDYSALTIWGVWLQSSEEQAPTRIAGVLTNITLPSQLPHRRRRIMLINAWRGRLSVNDLVNEVAWRCGRPLTEQDIAKKRKRRTPVDRLIIENKAAGYPVATEICRLHGSDDWMVELINPEGDKVARGYTVQPLFEAGIIYAPDMAWAQMVIEECADAPKGKHDDLYDTVTQAISKLRSMGLAERPQEADADVAARAMYRSPLKPLYAV